MKLISEYGEKVTGYNVRVLNEREARAAAGLLFAFGFLSLLNSMMLHHIIFSQYFIAFFTLDFLIRVINPSYAPSLLMGRFFVRNQTPEYVGATQKRFAWMIGLLLALPMFYLIVIDFSPNPIKVLICSICLILLLSESAFSICLGCKLYTLLNKKKSQYCPAGVCNIRKKDKIQTFNFAQKVITITMALFIFYGLYVFTITQPDKTLFMQHISKNYLNTQATFENDPDFDADF